MVRVWEWWDVGEASSARARALPVYIMVSSIRIHVTTYKAYRRGGQKCSVKSNEIDGWGDMINGQKERPKNEAVGDMMMNDG